MRVLVLALAIAALIITALAKPAEACSCLRREADDAYRWAHVVIVAKVIGGGDRDEVDDRRRVFELDVESVWKGDARYAMQIATGLGGGDCGRRLVKDERWIFFARRLHDGLLVTTICDASELATQQGIARMTKKFGAPKNPKR